MATAIGAGSASGAIGPGSATIAMAAHPARAASPQRLPSSTRGLDVLPFPGTPDAAPATNIDFPAVSPAQIEGVKVVGSLSGPHAGHLSAQPAGHGSAFSVDHPFLPGEHIRVTVKFRSPAAGTASGAPGAMHLRYTFSVARLASSTGANEAHPEVWSELADPNALAGSKRLTHTFVSEPQLHPPIVKMSGRAPDPRAGYIFLDAQNSRHPGAYFLNTKGDLVWFHPSTRRRRHAIFNVRVQSYKHRPVITYWQGRVVPPGVGEGKDLILNEHYQTIHTVTAGDGYHRRGTDLHEFTLGHEGSEGTAFVTIAAPTRANLTSVGGPADGTVLDWIIQEIDVATNKVIWEWQALGHVPVYDTYARYVPGHAFDYFHLNSIQQLSDDHIIISARNMWAVYSVDKATGKIVWELGGKRSSFTMGSGAGFEWQHDATLHNNGLLTLFDDNGPGALGQSRGLALRLSGSSATVIRSYFHRPKPALALSQGNVEVLSNHNVFIGWGSSPHFSEDGPSGAQLFGGSFRRPVQSYRAFRFKWVGAPLQPPAIAVRASSAAGRDEVYASWNGSTKVVRWQLEAGSSPTTLEPVKRFAHSSFESKVEVAKAKYFEVQALASDGRVLAHGTSAVVRGV